MVSRVRWNNESEEAAKHASEAHVMMRHFEEGVKKIKTQREGSL